MSRSVLLYFAVGVILVSGAFNLFDHVNPGTNIALKEELIQHRWVVAEVRHTGESAELTKKYNSTIWQFLHDGEFVQFSNDILAHSGEWKLKGNMLQLKTDGEQNEKIYQPERLRRNELLLKSDTQEVRLLKLSN